MSGLRSNLVVLCCLCVGLAVTACSEAPSQPLRVGINPWPGYGHLFLAADKGFFAEEGVEVELVELSSLSDVRRAFERGQIDGMASSLVEVLEAARNSDRKPVISVMADYSNGADVVLARKTFKGLAALKGRRIGIEPGTLNRFILARALAKSGLSLDDVRITNLAQLSMLDALAEGKVDAVVTYPPISTEIIRTGLVRKVFSSADIPGEVADVISFERSVVSHRSAEISAFSRAWGRAVAFAADHPAGAHEVIGRHIGMTTDELAGAYESIEVISTDRQAVFLAPDGPLSASMETLNSILWPNEGGIAAELSFVDEVKTSWARGQ